MENLRKLFRDCVYGWIELHWRVTSKEEIKTIFVAWGMWCELIELLIERAHNFMSCLISSLKEVYWKTTEKFLVKLFPFDKFHHFGWRKKKENLCQVNWAIKCLPQCLHKARKIFFDFLSPLPFFTTSQKNEQKSSN